MKHFYFVAFVLFCISFAACNSNDNKTGNSTADTIAQKPGITTPTDTAIQLQKAEETVFVSGDIYRSASGDIHVRYFEKYGKKVVGLLKDQDSEKILTQVAGSAFARGATYEGEGIKWQAKGNEGSWIEGGKTVKYKLAKN